MILALALVMLPRDSRGEIVLVRNITHSDAVILLNDKKLLNRQMELVSIDGQIAVGKLQGVAGASVLLKNAPSVPICSLRLVRISQKTASALRRGVGLVGGIIAGSLVGGPVALGIALAGAETAGIATYAAFPVIGGIVGSKLVQKSEDSIFVLDRYSAGAPCQESTKVEESPSRQQ